MRNRIFVTVNNFVYQRLTTLPEIQRFIEEAQELRKRHCSDFGYVWTVGE